MKPGPVPWCGGFGHQLSSGLGEEKSRYLLVWVGFLQTEGSIDLSGLCVTRRSRKASCPWDSVSSVNWMLSSMEFRWQCKSSTRLDLRAQHV